MQFCTQVDLASVSCYTSFVSTKYVYLPCFKRGHLIVLGALFELLWCFLRLSLTRAIITCCLSVNFSSFSHRTENKEASSGLVLLQELTERPWKGWFLRSIFSTVPGLNSFKLWSIVDKNISFLTVALDLAEVVLLTIYLILSLISKESKIPSTKWYWSKTH